LEFEVEFVEVARQMPWDTEHAFSERLVDDLRPSNKEIGLAMLRLDSKFRRIRSTQTEVASTSENDFERFGSTDVN